MDMMKYYSEFVAESNGQGLRCSPGLRAAAERLNIIGQEIEAQGKADAAKGLAACPQSAIAELGYGCFFAADEIGDLLSDCYKDGYNSVDKSNG